jgi:uroporphyrinogen-III synthase
MSDPSALTGLRVLVTRPRERAQELCFLLEDFGARVLALPILEIAPPRDPRPLRAAAERLERYAWVAFASPAAVGALVDAAREAGTLDRLRHAHVAVVGARTSGAAKSVGLTVDLEGSATGATLAAQLASRVQPGDEVLLPAAEEGRPELEEGLRAAGVDVTRVCAYRADRAPLDPGQLAAVRAEPPDLVLFASPRSAEAFLDATADEGRAWLGAARLVAIGPTTRAALETLGFQVAAVAEAPTPDGMAQAAVAAARLAKP